jgi:antitoxin PrlF
MENAMATIIEETSTITAKGQTTVPKAVRQALGVDYGGKIVYRIEDGRVTLHNVEVEHRDPALGRFLRMIEKDIAGGGRLGDLPAGLAAALRRAAKDVRVDLHAPLEGDVDL